MSTLQSVKRMVARELSVPLGTVHVDAYRIDGGEWTAFVRCADFVMSVYADKRTVAVGKLHDYVARMLRCGAGGE